MRDYRMSYHIQNRKFSIREEKMDFLKVEKKSRYCDAIKIIILREDGLLNLS